MTKKSRSVGNFPGYGTQIFFINDNSDIQIFREFNEVALIPNNERDLEIVDLLEENCDLSFCRDQSYEDFSFIALEHFCIFAVDSQGNVYGTIGNCGHINDREYPVGLVTKDGKCGKIAAFLKEFLELVNYYPYWKEIIEYERQGIYYSTDQLEKKYNMHTKVYLEKQRRIEKELNLDKNSKSLDLLLSSLDDDDQFVVFDHRYENLL